MPDLRALTLDMPGLSAGDAIPETFRASEGLSRLFQYEVEFYGTNTDLQASDFLGKSGTITLDFGDYTRPFNGIVRRFTAAGLDERGYRTYRLELVPSFWLLTRRSNSRIFENQTTKDIIEAVLGQGGFPFQLDIKGVRPTSRQRIYCVQYRETDFNFVCRLMEEEGIFYFFRQADGQHTMVVSDSTSIYEDCEQPELAYTEGNTVNADVTQWYHGYEFITGKWTQNDYNFETPRTNLLTTTSTRLNVPNAATYELYDYPGAYDKKPSDGEPLTTTRIEGEEAGYELVEAGSVNATLVTAGKFEMARHPIDSEEGKSYAVVSANHHAWWHRETQGGAATGYSAQIVSLPASVPYRPPRITPKPMIHGLQTAVVTGPQGEEIYTDEYGRIQVLFFWDREQTASCWIRVAQSISGNQWGDFYLPRIGQEVVVAFLEGDPDRPLVTGSVYNADNMPPFPLPDNKTQTGYKTHSTLKGGDDEFNELRFEDKKGSEEIYIQAQKDYNRYVKHDDSLKVDNDQTIEIKQDRTETVDEGDEKVTIKKGDRSHEVSKGDDSLKVGGDRDITVKKDHSLTVQEGDRDVTVELGSDSLKVMMGASSITALQQVQIACGPSTPSPPVPSAVPNAIGGAGAVQSIAGTLGANIPGVGGVIGAAGAVLGGTPGTPDPLSFVRVEPAEVTVQSIEVTVRALGRVEVDAPLIEIAPASDARLKTGIRDISGALAVVKRLRGVRFHWRRAEERAIGKDLKLPLDEPQIGFIAQEVEAALPEAVRPPKNPRDGYYAIKENNLLPILVEAVKEQQLLIDEMAAEIRALKTSKSASLRS